LKAKRDAAAKWKAEQESAARLKAEEEAAAALKLKAAKAQKRQEEKEAIKIASDIKKIEKKTGLPNRDSVEDSTAVLFSALTKKKKPGKAEKAAAAAKSQGPCDKCDGTHHESVCPHFKNKQRSSHRDAVDMYNKNKKSKAARGGGGCVDDDEEDDDDEPVIVSSRQVSVVSQPGDGNCLFHSMAHGLRSARAGRETSASSLRMELEDYMASHPHEEISDTPISDYILWDSQTSVKAYTGRMRSGNDWGGAIEIAVCARIKNVEIHVYEKKGGNFIRISKFEATNSDSAPRVVSVLYGGRCHYDAMVVRR
jgi:hypothetical protein